MLEIGAHFGDTAYASKFPEPTGYKMIYRSPVMGMENLWELMGERPGHCGHQSSRNNGGCRQLARKFLFGDGSCNR